ncbi:MAG: hypothetical protein C0467_12290 [Planctomycetaceae bacterium]|nr:hypothetical protein [Planctomycetaceae bacterium]
MTPAIAVEIAGLTRGWRCGYVPGSHALETIMAKLLKCLAVLVVVVAGLGASTGCSKAIQGASASAYNR